MAKVHQSIYDVASMMKHILRLSGGPDNVCLVQTVKRTKAGQVCHVVIKRLCLRELLALKAVELQTANTLVLEQFQDFVGANSG